LSLLMISFSK